MVFELLMHFSDGAFLNLPPISVLPILVFLEQLVEFPEEVSVYISEESLNYLHSLRVNACLQSLNEVIYFFFASLESLIQNLF